VREKRPYLGLVLGQGGKHFMLMCYVSTISLKLLLGGEVAASNTREYGANLSIHKENEVSEGVSVNSQV
jgi:hypothetical protein